MGVLKCDTATADAFVEKAIAFPGGGWYLECLIGIPSSTFAAIIANTSAGNRYTPFLIRLVAGGTKTAGVLLGDSTGSSAGLTSPATVETYHGAADAAGVFPADTWNLVQQHYDGTTIHTSINGVPQPNLDALMGGAGNPDTAEFGSPFANISPGYFAGQVYYFDNVKIGTTLGGSELFADDFEGTLSGWDSAEADATIVADPGFATPTTPEDPTEFMGPVKVSLAFDDTTLEPDPAWTHLTDTDSLVASYSIRRGRQFEFDKTDTGTATVSINDRHGVLDPTNSAGPYYTLIEPLRQIRIQLWNPVVGEYQTRFRGFIDEMNYLVEPFTHVGVSEQVGVTRLELECVGPFAILSAIEMQPGEFGDTPPTESEGNVFFDNAEVDDRILQVLGNAGWPVALSVVFSGNVYVKESVYSPSENVMQPLQDAADAEFPGVGNVYEDRLGRVVFHGRLARFDPVGVAADAGADAWDFHPWKCGDEEACQADVDMVQIRAFSFNRGTDKIINSAFATPNRPDLELTGAEIAGQYVKDVTSIGIYGYRSWSAENLLTDGGLTDGLDDLEETHLFATYYVANYAEPRNRVTELTIKSIRPEDDRGPAVWDLLSKIDIADTLAITVKHPGTGGFNAEPGFVEGLTEEAVPLNGEYALVTLSVDWSPAAYFTDPSGLDGLS